MPRQRSAPSPPENFPESQARVRVPPFSPAPAAARGALRAGVAAQPLRALGRPAQRPACSSEETRAAPHARAVAPRALRGFAEGGRWPARRAAESISPGGGPANPAAPLRRLNPPDQGLSDREALLPAPWFWLSLFARGWGGPAARCSAVRAPCVPPAGSFRSRSPASPAHFSHQIGH